MTNRARKLTNLNLCPLRTSGPSVDTTRMDLLECGILLSIYPGELRALTTSTEAYFHYVHGSGFQGGNAPRGRKRGLVIVYQASYASDLAPIYPTLGNSRHKGRSSGRRADTDMSRDPRLKTNNKDGLAAADHTFHDSWHG